MASGVTSGEAMAGMYNISTPRNGTRYYLSAYKSTSETQNNYITAGTYNTTSVDSNGARFRIIGVKNGSACSGAPSISGYKILSVLGGQTTTIGTQNTKHYLAPCYGPSVYTADTADSSKSGTTFNGESNGDGDACLWGFYQDGSLYNIVSYQAGKTINTSASTGKVMYGLSGKGSGDYEMLNLSRGTQIANNSWQHTFAGGTLTRREDCKIKVSGSGKTVTQPWIKVDGTWHKVIGCYIKVNGGGKLK